MNAVEKKIRAWILKREKEKCTCMIGRPPADAARLLPSRTTVRLCKVHGDKALAS